MKPRNTKDSKLISKRNCGTKYCKEKAYAITRAKFLCKFHFREIKPLKERHFRYRPSVRNRDNFDFVQSL